MVSNAESLRLADPGDPIHAAVLDWSRTALDIWAGPGTDSNFGGFHDQLDQSGTPIVLPKRCRVQARQIYAFTEAGRLGWNGPWRERMHDGVNFMLSRYVKSCGGVRFRVTPEGAPYDEYVYNYDQAFCIFALGHAYRVTQDRSLEDTARGILARLRDKRSHPDGGFYEHDEDAGPRKGPLLANPHMHLLEAALAWLDVGRDALWRKLAEDIVELCMSKFIDGETGALREFYDLEWRPAAGDAGETVEPGHLYEWAWLLNRAAGHSVGAQHGAELTETCKRLYGFANHYGLTDNGQIVIGEVSARGAARSLATRIWCQTERIKAAIAMSRLASHDSLEREADARNAWVGLQRFLDAPVPGLWFDRLDESGSTVPAAAPASSLYHLIGAVSELMGHACFGWNGR